MVSDLAVSDIERAEREFGPMAIADIVKLNALALKASDDPMSEMAMLPRTAVAGDALLRQPTIKQEIALAKLQAVYSRDGQTHVALVAYVLANPDIDADSEMKRPFKFALKVSRWCARHLGSETLDYVAACCQHCLAGTSQESGEYAELSEEAAKKLEKTFKPGADMSLAAWTSAVLAGIDGEAALKMTSPALHALLSSYWALSRGKPLKDSTKAAVAEYYKALDAVRKRMAAKKQKTMDKEPNG